MIVTDHDRTVITEDSQPYLRRYVRVRYDALRQKHVVLAPEKLYWPDEIGIAILGLCDGERTIAEIADILVEEYDAPYDVILKDVLEFVQEWTDKMLLKV